MPESAHVTHSAAAAAAVTDKALNRESNKCCYLPLHLCIQCSVDCYLKTKLQLHNRVFQKYAMVYCELNFPFSLT